MSLINNIEAIGTRVRRIKIAAKGIEESKKLQQRLTELQQVSNPLADRVTQVTLFRAQDIEVSLSQQVIDRARKRVENVQKRFRDSPEAKSLTEGKDWIYLKRYIGETEKDVDEALATSWHKFLQGVFTGEPHRDLDRALAPTDTNKRALADYEQEWRALRELAKRLPESDEEFANANKIAGRLRDIHGRFERDVPEEVKTFLEAVGREGAGLVLLTDGVRQWLEENHSINHYRIIAK